MSGHSKWSQIKHQKGITDQKRGQLFSKLTSAISVAAKTEQDPKFNPRLRSAIEKAEEYNVPQDKIHSAIARAAEKKENLEELLIEVYGSGGVAILIEAITDNKNRTVSELRKVISDYDGKWAEEGSVRWAFTQHQSPQGDLLWEPKFPQSVTPKDMEKIKELLSALRAHSDVQQVFSSTTPPL